MEHAMKTLSFVLGLVLVAVACSASNDNTSTVIQGACATLATRCHGIPTAIAKECHDLGHAGDDAKCTPRHSECLAACPEGMHEADAGDDAPSSSDAGADAANPACTAYCDCMSSRCGNEVNYPFTEESVCYAACASFSAAERTCFHDFCERAVDAGVKSHACETRHG